MAASMRSGAAMPGSTRATPAEVAKVHAIRTGIASTTPLALPSGVNEENVGDYLPDVHAFLVGTALESRLGVLDGARLRMRIQGP